MNEIKQGIDGSEGHDHIASPFLLEEDITAFPTWESVVSYPGYVASMDPQTDELIKIIGRYDLSGWHSCGLVDCCQPHMRGWVVMDTKSRVTNLGSRCGPKRFPNLSDLNVQFKKVNKAKQVRARLVAWNVKVDEVSLRLADLKSQAFGIQWLRALLKELRKDIPRDVMSALRRRADKNDTAVFETRQRSREEVADLVARGERAEAVRFEQIQIGALVGLEVFAKANALEVMVGQNIDLPLKQIKALAHHSAVSLIEATVKAADEAERLLEKLPDLAAAGLAFTSEANLRLLCLLAHDQNERSRLETMVIDLDPPKVVFRRGLNSKKRST